VGFIRDNVEPDGFELTGMNIVPGPRATGFVDCDDFHLAVVDPDAGPASSGMPKHIGVLPAQVGRHEPAGGLFMKGLD
jgi:hypothetical protein